ncbi:FecR family protein [Pseudomonas kuykendallii]|uniref:FecR family protein n=1 Tax=Pseudomonas kuykendallii TaxID=1007099 RepID=A0A2W5DA83_9PSED|nr:FecR domain-containing protein [Pseudomonas kuykendallii]PZP25330.1 MAG: hypothetical protein DI599_06085 [Pseudomonas kuykendallii]
MNEPATRAREWLVLLNSGRASAAQRAEAEAWRQASAANAEAWNRAQRLWGLIGELGSSAAAVDPAPLPAPRRRSRLGWAAPLAAAACLVIALWLPQERWVGWYADIHTGAGQLREVALEDGSILMLNGNTALDWDMHGGERHVRLYQGQADFQVAKDAEHPFVIQAGPARIRVTGTRFDVNYSGDRVLLSVTEGRVEASQDGQPAVAVTAQQQVLWQHGVLQAVRPLDASQALAWQRGRLVFRSRPLEEVFAELARYQDGRVLFLDDQARRLAVTGVFSRQQPQAVFDAIEATLPVRLTRLPGLLLVSAKGAQDPAR